MENLILKFEESESSKIIFNIGNINIDPIMEFCYNGDIFIKGKLIENDLEVVQIIREILEIKEHQYWIDKQEDLASDCENNDIDTECED
jgi:hypothetical protein